MLFRSLGLISQVAEELWEVANKTIKNLTKAEISIVDYKSNLVRQSMYPHHFLFVAFLITPSGNAAIEKAKLFSKTASKGKT